MSTNRARLANEATYEDVSKMVFRLCWVALIRWGGEWEDWLSAANMGFMDAVRTWKPERSSFVTHCWWCVHYALLDRRNGKGERWRGRETPEADLRGDDGRGPLADVPARPEPGVASLLRDLGEDGRTVVRLVVESPAELAKLARVGGRRHGDPSPAAARRAIGDHLAGLGWARARVVEAFGELREALEP